MLKRVFVGLVLVCSCAAASVALAQDVVSRVKSGFAFTIAYRESSIPFSYLPEGADKPIGYAIDLCLNIAEAVRKRAGLREMRIGYTPVTPVTRMAVIESGQADVECGSTTNNAERRKYVAFTVPHFITGARLLVRSDSGLRELEDLAGKKLVSTENTTPLKAAQAANRERALRINIVQAPDHARALQMVERGEAEAFVMDDVLLYGLIANHPSPKRFKVVGRLLTTEPLAIMMSKDDVELRRIALTEMRRLIAEREIHRLYERWFTQPIPPKGISLELPMSFLLRDSFKYPTDQALF